MDSHKQELLEHFHEMETDELEEKIRSDALTEIAREVAVLELASREKIPAGKYSSSATITSTLTHPVDYKSFWNMSGGGFGMIGKGSITVSPDKVAMKGNVRWRGWAYMGGIAAIVVALSILNYLVTRKSGAVGGVLWLYLGSLFFKSRGVVEIDRNTIANVTRQDCKVRFEATDPYEKKIKKGYFTAPSLDIATQLEAILLNKQQIVSNDVGEEEGLTELMVAAANGDANRVQQLIEAGADVNARSNSGATALIYSARNNHLTTAKALFSAGADVNATSTKGSTALSIAIRWNHSELIAYLVQHGAK